MRHEEVAAVRISLFQKFVQIQIVVLPPVGVEGGTDFKGAFPERVADAQTGNLRHDLIADDLRPDRPESAEAAGQNPAVPIPAHIGSLPWNADQNAVPGQGVERHLGDGQRYADFFGILPCRRKFRAAGEFSAFYLLQNIFPRRLKFI